mmetsp:Transcript_9146/g.20360  ORF Transcript_9146/g.20360 Transcript_9146/m.20360 type:complete len:984 (+) Transcript_9146:53-3004(+)
MALAGKWLKLTPGRPEPLGCTEVKTGVINFALKAPDTGSAWLAVTFPARHPALKVVGDENEGKELFIQLDASKGNRTEAIWHVEVTLGHPGRGMKYMWMLNAQLDGNGVPQGHVPRIIDPHALELDSPFAEAWNVRGKSKYSPKAVVPDIRINSFDWQGVKPPGYELKDLIIYEMHVRGFTRNPDSQVSDKSISGTFLGVVEKIPYLKQLGINCVELLPVFEFDETACPRKNPNNGEQLCHYWGYSTVAFKVPMQRFSSRDQASGAIVGFKTMVRELHRVGIEVMLDVVFNHTAEGTWGEHNWHSWAQIAKPHYYLLSRGQDTNYTGCGNTMSANNDLCAEWICSCLRYWVNEMHVDGFRFDLASAMCRMGDGKISNDPPLMRRIAADPSLARAKLIAEPWDCSWPDGYLVGRFPSGGPPRWGEWNGLFRDAARQFIKGDSGQKGHFATRLCGSEDLFKHNGRSPAHSINFITAHDGFTLRDLVSYNFKHNSCNGEDSGDDHNNSWNCGHEGDTGDGGIKRLRERQMRNFLVALFVSIGTPMIVFGDEYGRSQKGCNNGWCQDAISWFSWSDCEKQKSGLLRFVQLLIKLRKQHAHVFCKTHFIKDKDIWWRTHWDDDYNYLCYVLHDNSAGKYSGILIAFNAGHEVRQCDLPPGKEWHRIIDTNLQSPKDFCEDEASATKISGTYGMQPYSCIVLKCFADKQDLKSYKESDEAYAQLQDIEEHTAMVAQRRMSMEFTRQISPPEEIPDMPMAMVRTMSQSLISGDFMSRSRNFSRVLLERNASMSGSVMAEWRDDGTGTIDMLSFNTRDKSLTVLASDESYELPSYAAPATSGRELLAAEAATKKNGSAAAPPAPAASASTLPKDQVCSIMFEVDCGATKVGEHVAIVGSTPDIGSWEPKKAVPCETSATTFPVWSSTAKTLFAAGGKVEFKIIIRADNGNARWEHGENRTFELPASAGGKTAKVKLTWCRGGSELIWASSA